MLEDLTIQAQRSIERQGVVVAITMTGEDSQLWALTDDGWDIRVVGEVLPCHNISGSAAQTLMDQLYQAGVRPTDNVPSNALGATNAHLGDMRKLVSKFMKIDL